MLAVCVVACASVPNFQKQYSSFRTTLDGVRHHAVIRQRQDIPLLEIALSDPNPTVRRNAVSDLAALAPLQAEAERSLDTATQSDDEVIRTESSLAAWQWVSTPKPTVVAVLAQLSVSQTGQHSVAARHTLSRLSKWDDLSRSALADIDRREAEQHRSKEAKLLAEAQAKRQRTEQIESAYRIEAERKERAQARERERLAQLDAQENQRLRDKRIAQYGSIEAYEARLAEEQIKAELLRRGQHLTGVLNELRTTPPTRHRPERVRALQGSVQENVIFLERISKSETAKAANGAQLGAFMLLVTEVFVTMSNTYQEIAREGGEKSPELFAAAITGLETFGVPVPTPKPQPTPEPRIVTADEVYDFAQRQYRRLDRRDGEYLGRRHENEVWKAAAEEFGRSAQELEEMFLEESFRRDGVSGF